MAKDPAVALWSASTLITDGVELDRSFLTEVYSKTGKPRVGTVLIGIGDPAPPYNTSDQGEAEMIVGLAVISRFGGIAMGKVRARLEPWLVVRPKPLIETLDRARSVAESKEQGRLRSWPAHGPSPLVAATVDPVLGRSLLDVLTEGDPEVASWLDAVRRERPRPGEDPQAQARRETRDAVDLAAQLANVEIPAGAAADPPALAAETLLESVFRSATSGDLEEDLLPEDLRRFDGRIRAEMASASVAVFRSRQTQLVVYNVNKKPVEQVLGVDLVYWDQINDVFTLVQYKRLEKGPPGRGVAGTVEQWMYRRQSELARQLELMPEAVAAATHSKDWRMTNTPFWFKFVRGDAGASQDDRLLRGMYVPADWLRLAMIDDSLNTGPEGGFRVDYDNTRYVTRDVFVQLVQRGLVGTVEAQSELLHRVVQDLGAAGRSVVVAARAAWPGVTQRIGDSASAGVETDLQLSLDDLLDDA